jgi:hypothetical protein
MRNWRDAARAVLLRGHVTCAPHVLSAMLYGNATVEKQVTDAGAIVAGASPYDADDTNKAIETWPRPGCEEGIAAFFLSGRQLA